MKLFKFCVRMSLAAFVAACLSGTAGAQDNTINYPGGRDYETMRAERESQIMRRQMSRERERFKHESEQRRHRRTPSDVSAAPPSPGGKMTAEHKRRLYPSDAERVAVAALLKQNGTGLARLLPYTGCVVDPRIVNAGASCADRMPPVWGGGSFYSFRMKNHHLAVDSDIALRDNLFNVGFMKHTLGLLTTLGDVPLDAVTLESKAVRPFLKFVPAGTPAETEEAFKRSRAWLEAPDYVYGSTAPVRENTTYVLRSLAFERGGHKRSDVLVAFRVTRKDADGAVTVAWKQLQKPKG
jgi:hypothetical protein